MWLECLKIWLYNSLSILKNTELIFQLKQLIYQKISTNFTAAIVSGEENYKSPSYVISLKATNQTICPCTLYLEVILSCPAHLEDLWYRMGKITHPLPFQ